MKKSLGKRIIESWSREKKIAERFAERIGERVSERQQSIAPREEKLTQNDRLEITVPHTRQR